MEDVDGNGDFSKPQGISEVPGRPKQKNMTLSVLSRQVEKGRGFISGDLLKAAEDKLVDKFTLEEMNCLLPDSPRSTFLMVFSPDGKKVASTHGNHNVYVTDLTTGKNIQTLSGHPRTPWCIAFHPSSNQILATGCLGGQVRVWDLSGGSEVWTAENQTVIASLAFHPVDRMLVIATFNELLFWDWSQPEPFAKRSTKTDKEKVRYVTFDRLGNKLITGIANPIQSQWDRGPTFSVTPSNPATSTAARVTVNHSYSSELDQGIFDYRPRMDHYNHLVNHYWGTSPRLELSRTTHTPTTDRGSDPIDLADAENQLRRGRGTQATTSNSEPEPSTSGIAPAASRARDDVIDDDDDSVDLELEDNDPVVPATSTISSSFLTPSRFTFSNQNGGTSTAATRPADVTSPTFASLGLRASPREATRRDSPGPYSTDLLRALLREVSANRTARNRNSESQSSEEADVDTTEGDGRSDSPRALGSSGPSDHPRPVPRFQLRPRLLQEPSYQLRLLRDPPRRFIVRPVGQFVLSRHSNSPFQPRIAYRSEPRLPAPTPQSPPFPPGSFPLRVAVPLCPTISLPVDPLLAPDSPPIHRPGIPLQFPPLQTDPSPVPATISLPLDSQQTENSEIPPTISLPLDSVDPESPPSRPSSPHVSFALDMPSSVTHLISRRPNPYELDDDLPPPYIRSPTGERFPLSIPSDSSSFTPTSPRGRTQEQMQIRHLYERCRMFLRESSDQPASDTTTNYSSLAREEPGPDISWDANTDTLIIRPCSSTSSWPVVTPAEQPPTAAQPVEQPPTAAPLAEQPPTAAPLVEQPPVEQPPTAAPPAEQPPTAAPPAEQPPTAAPPAEQPPTLRTTVESLTHHIQRIQHTFSNFRDRMRWLYRDEDYQTHPMRNVRVVLGVRHRDGTILTTEFDSPSLSNSRDAAAQELGFNQELYDQMSRLRSNMQAIRDGVDAAVRGGSGSLPSVSSMLEDATAGSAPLSNEGPHPPSTMTLTFVPACRKLAAVMARELMSRTNQRMEPQPGPSSTPQAGPSSPSTVESRLRDVLTQVLHDSTVFWEETVNNQHIPPNAATLAEFDQERILPSIPQAQLSQHAAPATELVTNSELARLSSHIFMLELNMQRAVRQPYIRRAMLRRQSLGPLPRTQQPESCRSCGSSLKRKGTNPQRFRGEKYTRDFNGARREEAGPSTSTANPTPKRDAATSPGLVPDEAAPSAPASADGPASPPRRRPSPALATLIGTSSSSSGDNDDDSSSPSSGPFVPVATTSGDASTSDPQPSSSTAEPSFQRGRVDDLYSMIEKVGLMVRYQREAFNGGSQQTSLSNDESVMLAALNVLIEHTGLPSGISFTPGQIRAVRRDISQLRAHRLLDSIVRGITVFFENVRVIDRDIIFLNSLLQIGLELTDLIIDHVRAIMHRLDLNRNLSTAPNVTASTTTTTTTAQPLNIMHRTDAMGVAARLERARMAMRLHSMHRTRSAVERRSEIYHALQARRQRLDSSLEQARQAHNNRSAGLRPSTRTITSARIATPLASFPLVVGAGATMRGRMPFMGVQDLPRPQETTAPDLGDSSNSPVSGADQSPSRLAARRRAARMHTDDPRAPRNSAMGLRVREQVRSFSRMLERWRSIEGQDVPSTPRQSSERSTPGDLPTAPPSPTLGPFVGLTRRQLLSRINRNLSPPPRGGAAWDSEDPPRAPPRARPRDSVPSVFNVPVVHVEPFPQLADAEVGGDVGHYVTPRIIRAPYESNEEIRWRQWRPRFLNPRYGGPNPFDEQELPPPNMYRESFMQPGIYMDMMSDPPQATHHRIQAWDFARNIIPDISDRDLNGVVAECKIHNDASVDISSDGQLLVTLLPSGRLSATTMLGVYSLDWNSLGQLLYKTGFEHNAVSVSLSPTNRYLLVGLASRPLVVRDRDRDRTNMAQIYRLEGAQVDPPTPTWNGTGILRLVRNLQQPRDINAVSLNCIRWAPGAGQGLIYGTNAGQLKVLR